MAWPSHETLGDVEQVHRSTLAAAGAGDFPHELGHDGRGVEPPGQSVAVVAVVGDDVVVVPKDRNGPDGYRLLPVVLVEESPDLAFLV